MSLLLSMLTPGDTVTADSNSQAERTWHGIFCNLIIIVQSVEERSRAGRGEAG